MEEPIVAFDWMRMFVGDQPALFYLEIVFRIAVIWLWTLALLRWIGGRSVAQLSLTEFLLVIALGSAVGDSLFYPDVPLFQAMLVVLCIVCLDKLVDWAIRRWKGAKAIIDGQPAEVLRDGRIITDGLNINRIGAYELMEMLRIKGVMNLASISHAYIEPSGQLSAFPAPNPGMGLAIVPPLQLGVVPPGTDQNCCCGCGMLRHDFSPCPACGALDQTPAAQASAWQP
ncbi:DUF421 domain-containing protein [Pseudotabrizicola formosa]|uniref:DUF421 domain-containing protein n=1 Tax=Pseudotabrizicola formosa TaxID=2030009 RepID=UPI000CD309F3|nr:YetF domain-containing protein [Pseudotabrizicola formosa]